MLPAGQDFAACRDLWTDMETIQATIHCELHTGFALGRKSRSASGTYPNALSPAACRKTIEQDPSQKKAPSPSDR